MEERADLVGVADVKKDITPAVVTRMIRAVVVTAVTMRMIVAAVEGGVAVAPMATVIKIKSVAALR